MALFSKPPAKKPDPVKVEPRARAAAARVRAPSARQVLNDLSPRARPEAPKRAGDAKPAALKSNIIEWTPTPAVELASASAGLCAVLENAALLFASGHSEEARQVLEQGIAQDADARGSLFTWLALFDVLQRTGDRNAFDALALNFVVEFERSAPAWEERPDPAPGRPAGMGAYTALSGKLTAASAVQLEPLKRFQGQPGAAVRLDLRAVQGYDDTGARLLADALSEARRLGVAVAVEHSEHLRSMLEGAVNEGRRGGEGAWLLLLELLQWDGNQAAFDDRAVEYAVTFELSPPSWEALPLPVSCAAAEMADTVGANDADMMACSEVISGTAQVLPELFEFALQRSVVLLDFRRVERIDFVSAGGLVNAISRLESQGKTVQIVGASPMVRALLLLVGVAPDLLVRKVA